MKTFAVAALALLVSTSVAFAGSHKHHYHHHKKKDGPIEIPTGIDVPGGTYIDELGKQIDPNSLKDLLKGVNPGAGYFNAFNSGGGGGD